ncbi:MAG: hypothetical protein H6577_24085 [Lewinellaceae bacterium]|nr:hypothetical protein [Lewinellaceae bacterium]
MEAKLSFSAKTESSGSGTAGRRDPEVVDPGPFLVPCPECPVLFALERGKGAVFLRRHRDDAFFRPDFLLCQRKRRRRIRRRPRERRRAGRRFCFAPGVGASEEIFPQGAWIFSP